MSDPTPSDVAVDAFVDLLMRGEAPSIEEWAARHPELGPAEIARLGKLVRAIGGARPAARPAGELPFESIGSYKLLSRLGAGGMGIVYLAEDVRLGRRVALKVVRPELAGSSDTLSRFEREARAVAKLRHEGIVTVYEAGRENGVPFIAMELVHGQSLDEIYAESSREHRRVHVEDLVRWTRDVARALAAAHAAGIVHRDVKPSNVRVTPEGKALLLDFGLALDPDSASISRTGQLHGTLFYVSPEQVSGGKAKVDARTDVWSLAATLYEGLTGRVPFEGEHSEEVLYRILSADPIAPRSLAPELSRDLETIVLKALEKDRERRYPSAAAFASDLDALLEHRPIHARPTGAITNVLKWGRRKPAHATAAALATLLLVGGPATYAFVQTRHARSLEAEKQLAVEQRGIAETRARELEEMATFQGRVLGQVEPQRMGAHLVEELRNEARAAWSRESLSDDERAARLDELDRLLARANATNVAVSALRDDVLEPAIAAVADHFADRPKVRGMLLHAIAGTCGELGLSDLALATQREAFDLLVASAPPDDRDRLAVQANLGWYLLSAGRGAEAEPHLRAAAEGLERVDGPDDPSTLAARHNLALLLRSLERHDESELVLRDVLGRRRRVLGDDDPATLSSLGNLGALVLVRGRKAEAEPILRESYERRTRVLGLGSESTLTTANNLAVLCRDLGRIADAESVFRDAFDAARESLGDRHPVTAFLAGGLGEMLDAGGCSDEAEIALRRAAAISAAVSGPVHPDTLYATTKLASLLRRAGRWDEAEAVLASAYGDVCASIGETHVDARNVVNQYALLLRDEGRFAEAADLFEHLEHAAREQLGPQHARVQRLAAERVRTLAAARRFADAQRALLETRDAMPSDSPPSAELVEAAIALYEGWWSVDPSRTDPAVLEQWTRLRN